jgi:pyruvate dehydrogenase complex dehydrogenase (E1) component
MRRELLDELVTAAQEVVNNADVSSMTGEDGEHVRAVLEADFERLSRVVRAISDEAWATIQQATREARS